MTTSLRRFVIDMYSSRYPLWCMPDGDVERIRSELRAGWEVVRLKGEADGSGDGAGGFSAELEAALAGAEVYCGFGIAPEVLAAGSELRWVHSGAAGVGGSLTPEMMGSDVVFTNSAGTHGVPVAEHAVAMIFYFARAFDRLVPGQSESRWDREPLSRFDSPVRELTDSTLGVIGYGGIGREVARRGKGLGMRVWATRKRVDEGGTEELDRLLPSRKVKELLAASDYVVVTVPHTPETEGLIGAAELEAMKETGVLINVARGSIIDEEALIEALRKGALRGAGLDVFRKEPLPPESPLWGLENAYVTPHVAGISPRFWERETDLIVENTRRYLAGEPLINVVNKRAGY